MSIGGTYGVKIEICFGNTGRSESRLKHPWTLGPRDYAPQHLIPEVRPLPGQRVALFKNAPGVFVHGVGRFPPLPVFPPP